MTKGIYILVASLVGTTIGCPDQLAPWTKPARNHARDLSHVKRSAPTGPAWTYQEANDWGNLSPDYIDCRIGNQQAPIHLSTATTSSNRHNLAIDYPSSIKGTLSNWGYGPNFTLTALVDSGNFSSSTASITFKEDDNSEPETAYFGSWHTHNPSEHLVDGKHLQGEMHFVHYTADGTPRSVIAHRIEPSDDVKDSFFSQLPELFTTEQKSMDQDINLDLSSVSEIAGLWTYQGSLTTPPCSQGIRWFVVEEPLKVSNKDLQRWLRASKYSARPEQFLWEQHLNK